MRNRTRTIILMAAALVLALILASAPASAKNDGEHGGGNGKKPPPVTKIRFFLDDHSVAVGESLTSDVRVMTRVKNAWDPIEGASLVVRVDGADVSTLTTDADGRAALSVPATEEGGHVMRVVFLGDDLHKRAWRAQGFEVSAAEEPPVEEPPAEEPPAEEPPVEDPPVEDPPIDPRA